MAFVGGGGRKNKQEFYLKFFRFWYIRMFISIDFNMFFIDLRQILYLRVYFYILVFISIDIDIFFRDFRQPLYFYL